MRRNPRDVEPYETLDGSLVYELVRPEFSEIKSMSLAVAVIPPGESTRPHYHEFDEVYWILEGRGTVYLDDRALEVGPEDCVEIPRGTVHWVRNEGTEPMRILCVCSPPYRHEGTTLVSGRGRSR